jgi:uncharacterized membrane protein HdeD (DUF308 family)
MHHIMAKFWWILAVRGVLGILLGSAAIGWVLSLESTALDVYGLSIFTRSANIVAALILLLGLYAFVDGIFAVVLGAQDYGGGQRWKGLIAVGLLSIGLGVVAWVSLGVSVLALLYWIAAWAFLSGLFEVSQAASWNEYKERRWPLLLTGLSSIAYGLFVCLPPVRGFLLIWSTALYAFASGIPLLVLAIRLRHFRKAYPLP